MPIVPGILAAVIALPLWRFAMEDRGIYPLFKHRPILKEAVWDQLIYSPRIM